MKNTPITRFAPSPTGGLHLGSARTAIFNWLFTRHHQGKFLLRIEDTDTQRSNKEFVNDILQTMTWLELDDYDDTVYYQTQHQKKHLDIAMQLLKNGHAYRCYCTPEELAAQKAQNKKIGKPPKYSGKCRNLQNQNTKSPSLPYVIRLMTPQNQKIVIQDLIQGNIIWRSQDLDDFVLVRSDGTPTYMLSVVVDDHNMGITHVIRGNDHLSNTPKQYLIYQAMQWQLPIFAHLPLIHTTDNVKLSKRHGAVTVQDYKEQGFLPQALFNYLLRLGWSYGDEEIISRQQAKAWFNTKNLGKSPSKFDMIKLLGINKKYMQKLTTDEIMQLIIPFWQKLYNKPWNALEKKRLHNLMPELQIRSNTLLALTEACGIVRNLDRVETFSPKAEKIIKNNLSKLVLIYKLFVKIPKHDWRREVLQQVLDDISRTKNLSKSILAQTIRAAITGNHVSPSIYDVLTCIGSTESLNRILNTIHHYSY